MAGDLKAFEGPFTDRDGEGDEEGVSAVSQTSQSVTNPSVTRGSFM